MAEGSEKNAAFHRLAGQRVERILDALRIWSNLCGPSYERSPDEVLTYHRQIEEGLVQALARYQEQKWWRDAQPAAPEPEPVSSDPEPEKPAPAPPQRPSRASTIAELLTNAQTSEVETLAEMVAMQREVIEGLQRKLDEARNAK